MSRTDRDQKRYQHRHHHKVCTRWINVGRFKSRPGWCECLDWHEYQHARFWPVPSWWNRGIRQQERSFTRNLMQRSRAGRIDWERVDDRKGDEYYW